MNFADLFYSSKIVLGLEVGRFGGQKSKVEGRRSKVESRKSKVESLKSEKIIVLNRQRYLGIDKS